MLTAGLRLLYWDKRILVVNKPTSLVSQLQGNIDPVGIGRLLKNIQREYGIEGDIFPVHRLDKHTSGCLVFARQKSSARDLAQQFQRRDDSVLKSYLAIVHGKSMSVSGSSGQICVPLVFRNGRVLLAENDLVNVPQKSSVTDWQVLSSSRSHGVSLVHLQPRTGYKHQLRVHMAYFMNAPILGDGLHGTPFTHPLWKLSERMYLHASRISFWRHKPSGRRIRLSIQSPLPLDFTAVCESTEMTTPAFVKESGVFIDESPATVDQLSEMYGNWVGSNTT